MKIVLMKACHIFYILTLLILVSPPLADAAETDLERDLQISLDQTRSIIAKISKKLADGDSTANESDRLRAIAENVRASHLLLLGRFRLREQKVGNMGANAPGRHRVMVEDYVRALETYLTLVERLLSGEKPLETILSDLDALLDRILYKKKPLIFGSLPYRNLNYPAKEPIEAPSIKPAYRGGNKIGSPDDLKSTPGAPISEEIAAFAESLEWNPVLIYEWVKNNIETEWYWGCMKGAEETLRQGSGNDCDQASLLIALLRASGFPSRYVRGVIEYFPGLEKAQNLTGIEDPANLARFFQKAGIPHKPLVKGGQIANFQVEHVWVESEIPFANFHGTVIDEYGKTWLGLDTSIKVKDYDYHAPLDILGELSLADNIGEYLSLPRYQTPLDDVRERIEDHLGQNYSNKVYTDLLRTRTLAPEIMNILPASLQFRQISISHEYTEIPDQLIHKVKFSASQTSGDELFQIILETRKLSNRMISIDYAPETVEDQETINAYGGLGNTPAYLARLRPVLKVGGETVAVGRDGLPIGALFTLDMEIISPNGVQRVTNTHITGNMAVIGVVSGKAVIPEPLPEAERDAERLLYEMAIRYIDRWNQAEEELASLLQLSITRPVPTVVTLGGVMEVTYLLDTPHGFEWKGLYVDADLKAVETVISRHATDEGQKTFMRLSSLEGSVLENRIFEDDLQLESISTAKLFGLANTNGIPILSIDSSSMERLLPTLPLADSIKADITNAVNQGLTVDIPQSEIAHEDWTGIGYIKENPDTGESGWMLSGMIAGGMTVKEMKKWKEVSAWLEKIGQLFSDPYTEPPNYDPASAHFIYKVSASDRQKGKVGEPLPMPLSVKVFDTNGKPVRGAKVTFTVLAGGGTFIKDVDASVTTATTGTNGIASAPLFLGKKTSDNRTFWWEAGYTYSQQVGLNMVDASLDSGTGITSSFLAYGFPKEPKAMRKLHGDNSQAPVYAFSGFVSVIVDDEYGNPISNLPVQFEALSPVGGCGVDTGPASLVEEGDTCLEAYATYGECSTGSQKMQVKTNHQGTHAQVVLGGRSDAAYPIKATYGSLSRTFSPRTDFIAGCNNPQPKLWLGIVYPTDSYGNLVNAARVGGQIPLRARLLVLRGEDGEFAIDTQYTNPNVTFDGQLGTKVTKGLPGVYTSNSGKLTQGVNNIDIVASAVVEGRTFHTRNTTVAYGVQVENLRIEDPTTNAPLSIVPLNPFGYTKKDFDIAYSIAPSEYVARIAHIVLFKKEANNDVPARYYVAGRHDDYTLTLTKGSWFDKHSKYNAEVVLNKGSTFQGNSLEITSDRVPVNVVSTEVLADDARLTTTVDRINGDICTATDYLEFYLFQNAEVTIEVDGLVIEQTVSGQKVPVKDMAFPEGANKVLITRDMVPLPGEHDFEISAVYSASNPKVEALATGTIVHEVVINEFFPVGHTFIKGVDLQDGHLTHSSKDVGIPGRGLSLNFTRSYGSVGSSSDGPIGAGWTHTYNMRIIRDGCGRLAVVGGEGTGNAFTKPHKDPTRAALFGLPPAVDFYTPQIGYHSTLVRDPQAPSKLDFYNRAHIKYHFELEKLYSNKEIYTLRYVEEPNGNRITLKYDVPKPQGDSDPLTLDTVTDSSGRALAFNYQTYADIENNSNKRIRKIIGYNSLTGGDLLGLEITYEYDGQNNLIKVIRKSPGTGSGFSDERVEKYTYTTGPPQERHNMLSYTDPNGNTTKYVYYDKTDNVPGFVASFGVQKNEIIKTVDQPEGVSTNFTYDFNNKTREVSDPRPNVAPTKYTLNDYGATVQIDAPMGKTTNMVWCTATPHPSCNGIKDVLMVARTDAEERTTEIEYLDGLGNVTKETTRFTGSKAPVTLKDGTTSVTEVTTSNTYDPIFSKITGKTDAEGNTTLYQIDSNSYQGPAFCPAGSGNTGNLLGIKDAEGNITCFSYYANGDKNSVTNPRNFKTLYTLYDSYGNAEEVIDPEGNVTTNIFDERSRLVEIYDTFTHHTKYTYDGLDRKVKEERLDDLGKNGTPRITSYRYKPNGELRELTDGLGQVTEYLYDKMNRRKKVTEKGIIQADGSSVDYVSEYFYDEGSNLETQIDARGITRRNTYDDLNRLVMTEIISGPSTGPNNNSGVMATFGYDLVDNKLSETDLHGHKTTFVYDGLYRVVETRLPFSHGFKDVPFQNAVIKTAFDRMGNKVMETDANGNPALNKYDGIYRLTEKTDAEGNTISYEYDAAGNKTREVNQSSGLVTQWTAPDPDGLNRPRVERQTVPLGNAGLTTAVYETRFDYQDSDNAVVVTNPRGFKTRTDKDGLDRVFKTIVGVDSLKLTTTFTYDGNGNVKTVKDPEGGDIDVTHTYDGLDRKIRSVYVGTPGDGGKTVEEKFFYDGNNIRIQYEDKRAIVFTETYDNLNRKLIRRVKETLTNSGIELVLQTYAYDDAQNRVTETDANGNQTITRFDELHRPVKIDDPDPAGLIRYEYDSVNKRVEIDKKDQQTEYDYDAINRRIDTREYDKGGSQQTTLQVKYDDQKNRVEETDRRGVTTVRQLDALQRLAQLRRQGLDMASHYGAGDVLLETYEYDGNGNKIAFIDGQGNRTEYTYDGADRQITLTQGAGSPVAATTTSTYDKANNVLTVKDGRQHGGAFDTKFAYDARYRRITAANGENETTTYAYDANDNLVRLTEPKGQAFTTIYEYDELNGILSVDETPRMGSTADAGVTRFFYDGNRNKIAQQDANGNLVTYTYDGLNRLTDSYQHTVIGALSDGTVRGGDPRGSSLAAGGDTTSALHWQYAYDLNGNRAHIIDARGQRVNMAHDYLDRLITRTYSQHAEPGLEFQKQSLVYQYDGNSNMTSITEVKRLGGADVTEMTIQTFDPLNRLQTRLHRDHDDPAGKLIAYDYDIQGNRTAVIDPDGLQTSYSYDARNRLHMVTTEGGLSTAATTTYTWWEDDLLKQVSYPNSTVSDRSAGNAYDRADRIQRIVNRPDGISLPEFSVYEYDYDKNGNRTRQIETQPALNGGLSETTVYTYDRLNRLQSVTYGAGAASPTLSYTYAPNSNRSTEVGYDPVSGQPVDRTYKYEALPGKPGTTFDHVNTLAQIVDNIDPGRTVAYEYDENLNRVAEEKGGNRTACHFGIRDQILLVNPPSGPAMRFDYDHDRMRVKKISDAGGKETRYLYDQTAVLVEYDGNDATLPTFHKYDYGYELLSLTTVTQAGQNRDSEFYLTDGLMSTVNLTDESGKLKHSYRYDAWGRIRSQAGSSDNPRQYTGHYKDEETGLHYFGARYYDDETGRFLSQDPYLGEANNPPSLHRYLYAYGNPLRYVDLKGYQPLTLRQRLIQFAKSQQRNLTREELNAIVVSEMSPEEFTTYSLAQYRKLQEAPIKEFKPLTLNDVLAMSEEIRPSNLFDVLNATLVYTLVSVVNGILSMPEELVGQHVQFVKDPSLSKLPILGPVGTAWGESAASAVVDPSVENISKAIGGTAGAVGTALGGAGLIRGAGLTGAVRTAPKPPMRVNLLSREPSPSRFHRITQGIKRRLTRRGGAKKVEVSPDLRQAMAELTEELSEEAIAFRSSPLQLVEHGGRLFKVVHTPEGPIAMFQSRGYFEHQGGIQGIRGVWYKTEGVDPVYITKPVREGPRLQGREIDISRRLGLEYPSTDIPAGTPSLTWDQMNTFLQQRGVKLRPYLEDLMKELP